MTIDSAYDLGYGNSIELPALGRLIDRSGYKQSTIAWKIGVDAALISAWRRGMRLVPRNRVRPLADALDVTVADLLAGSEVDPQPVRAGSVPSTNGVAPATLAPPPAAQSAQETAPVVDQLPEPLQHRPDAQRRLVTYSTTASLTLGPGDHTHCSCGQRVR